MIVMKNLMYVLNFTMISMAFPAYGADSCTTIFADVSTSHIETRYENPFKGQPRRVLSESEFSDFYQKYFVDYYKILEHNRRSEGWRNKGEVQLDLARMSRLSEKAQEKIHAIRLDLMDLGYFSPGSQALPNKIAKKISHKEVVPRDTLVLAAFLKMDRLIHVDKEALNSFVLERAMETFEKMQTSSDSRLRALATEGKLDRKTMVNILKERVNNNGLRALSVAFYLPNFMFEALRGYCVPIDVGFRSHPEHTPTGGHGVYTHLFQMAFLLPEIKKEMGGNMTDFLKYWRSKEAKALWTGYFEGGGFRSYGYATLSQPFHVNEKILPMIELYTGPTDGYGAQVSSANKRSFNAEDLIRMGLEEAQ